MPRNFSYFLFVLFLSISPLFAESYSEPVLPHISVLEPINRGERVLILAPHPDDESIGCAGIVQKALKAQAQVKVIYLTNGDINELSFIVHEKHLALRKDEFIRLGQIRRAEAVKAMQLLGLSDNDLFFLGYPDFGTFDIFCKHWNPAKPYRSFLTRISGVPYKDDFSFGAPYVGQSVLIDLKNILSEYRPTKIFLSHPLDTNGDHRAFYLFLQVAILDLKGEFPEPKIYPYLIHSSGWPLPRHYHPKLSLEPPKRFKNVGLNWLKSDLAPEEVEQKYRAVLAYKSQTSSSGFYLLAFVRKNELFSDYPRLELERRNALKESGPLFFNFPEIYGHPEISAPGEVGAVITKGEGRVSYAVVDGYFLIRVDKPKVLKQRLATLFYLFGYSHTRPFANMPKITIYTRYNQFKIFDKGKRIQAEGVALELTEKTLTLKVPFKLLGDPDYVLTSIKAFTSRSYENTFPTEVAGFRKIEIRGKRGGGSGNNISKN